MEIHQQIKEARTRAGLTQAQLAQLAGVNRMYISRLENGENLTMRTFLKIATALHLEFGAAQPAKPEETPASDGEQLRSRAAQVLEEVRQSREAAAAENPSAAPREVSLVRTLAELLLELTGGK